MDHEQWRALVGLTLGFLLVGIGGSSLPLYGQSKTGTTIGQFLLIEPSARTTWMGNAGVAATEELLAAYYNPGAIGSFKGYGVQFTHSLWLADITYDYAAAVVAMGSYGNLYLSATALNSGEIAVRTVEQPLGTGENYSVNDFAFGLGFGRQLTDRFTAGFQVNFMQETIWHSSLSTFTFNVGTVYTLSGSGIRIGASISNFGLPGKYSGRDLRIVYDKDPAKYGDNSNLPGLMYVEDYPPPVLFRAGIDWPIKISRRNEVHLAVNAFHPNDNTESISLGGEWLFMKTLALRAGYQNLWLKDSEVGLTLGTGVIFDLGGTLFHVDYAWADHGRLENTQRFTLGLDFE
ncbi:MAG TPA: PorV/PorQ family protein [bacterium]|nr:PorV/PorQ family protein [bacterium]